jgi:vacuolar-type H+-ATPase subunit E/Vma4
MTPDDIDRDLEAEVKRIEETVIDEVQKDEEEVNRLIDHEAEEQKKYKDVTGWPPV